MEIAIKVSLDKLRLPYELPTLTHLCRDNGFVLRPISAETALAVASLPWHHRDPFDRLLVAECKIAEMRIISRDQKLDAYGVRRVWGVT